MKELWKLSYPLMLTSFSFMLMLFTDRFLLVNFSLQAFNAVSVAMTTGWVFILGWGFIASISEVFVAQNNGAGNLNHLGESVWQMIWLSLASACFFIPLAIFGAPLLFSEPMEQSYFACMMLFSPFICLSSALSGFYIGQGKTGLITITMIVANIINVTLDVVLIFGIEGILLPMGITGAAIATSLCAVFQSLVLFIVFLNRDNRQHKGSSNWKLNIKLFLECVKVGLPGAAFASIEILGWAIFYRMMASVGEKHITIAGIFQSFCLLFYFFGEGMGKAATSITGNFIGAKKPHLIPKVILSGILLHLIFFAFLLVLFTFWGQSLSASFIPDHDVDLKMAIEASLPTCLFLLLFYSLFEGIRLLLTGVLTAAGDTVFLLIVGTLSVWAMLILPIYFLVTIPEGEIELAILISAIYGACAVLLYAFRIVNGKWRSIQLI